MPDRRALTSPRQQFTHLAVNGLVFGLCYSWTNWVAERDGARPLATDVSVPFIPWMVVPYLTSGLVFVAVFMLTSERAQLRLLSQRTLLVTAIAAACFTLFPWRFAFPRPPVDAALPAALFTLLEAVDRPFNQLPSLHVAYAVAFWPSLQNVCRTAALRITMSVWLLLLAASAALTWQHNLIDLFAGAALGFAALRFIQRPLYGAQAVCFHYAIASALVAILLAYPLRSWVAAYISVSLMLVCLAYSRRDPAFLRKRDGRHPLPMCLLFAPYLTGYRVTWHLVRRAQPGCSPLVQHTPWLWAGRRLSGSETDCLPPDCFTIDLSAELSEAPALRGRRYLHIPLLDLHAPTPSVLRHLRRTVDELHRQGHPVFIHCAMGLRRSQLVARIIARGARHEPIHLPA